MRLAQVSPFPDEDSGEFDGDGLPLGESDLSDSSGDSPAGSPPPYALRPVGASDSQTDDELVNPGDSPWGAAEEKVEELLTRARNGDKQAERELIEEVYPHLHAIASRIFAGQKSDHTLQVTALIHEAFLKFAMGGTDKVNNATHLYRLLARAMRQVLTDHARGKRRLKRPQSNDRVDVDLTSLLVNEFEERIGGPTEALESALEVLEVEYPHMAELVDLRFFAALSNREYAQLKGISEQKSKRDWDLAKGQVKRLMERYTR